MVGANLLKTKEEIFEDIQKIMLNDYAGCLDKQHINRPSDYIVFNDMSDSAFVETIQDYLLDFQDGHLGFISKRVKLPNRGFLVRRYEDALYITKSIQEKNLDIGDRIVEIDGENILTVASKWSKRLEEKESERQKWDTVLQKSAYIKVEKAGKVFEMDLASYTSRPYKPEHTFKLIDNQTAYIKLTDFAEAAPILEIIHHNKKILDNINNLIIDVRVNYGGNDLFYFPLLHYVFAEHIEFTELFAEDEVMYTNYTERNCEMWIQGLEDYLKQDLDKETAQIIQEDINAVKNNNGFKEEFEEDNFMIQGRCKPNHVYVLSDYSCGSSGDTFIGNLKKSSKVTVVGRPTKGIMDYFNVVTVDYHDFEFWYGISKMNSNYSINGKGVEPDIYIPWTPEHFKKDIDLAYVLNCIKNS